MVLSALIMMAGIWSLTRTEVDIFPDLTAPTVVIMTEASGLAPEEVEHQVTYPIESAVNGVSGIRRVRSASNPGFSVIKRPAVPASFNVKSKCASAIPISTF